MVQDKIAIFFQIPWKIVPHHSKKLSRISTKGKTKVLNAERKINTSHKQSGTTIRKTAYFKLETTDSGKKKRAISSKCLKEKYNKIKTCQPAYVFQEERGGCISYQDGISGIRFLFLPQPPKTVKIYETQWASSHWISERQGP